MSRNPEVHFDGKIAQKAIIARDGKVLVIRDPREKEEIWELPGGRLNEGEIPQVGLAREIKEELGVDCVVGKIVYLAQFWQKSEERNALMIAYEATIDADAALHFADAEICDARWIEESDMNDLKFFGEYKDALTMYFAKHV